MYHPTSRVLTVLELLQARAFISGPELAGRLEMDVRTVRRYITHLQDSGIPIEATIGRHGGYRLRPGFKLPPLIFTEEEGTAIMLGLLASTWLEIGQSAFALEGALAKVSRVLPIAARERLQALATHLVLFPHNQQSRPDASLLIDLSGAIQAAQRMKLVYRSQQQVETQRVVDPYGITGWNGHWYLAAYCHLRRDFRTFRLDAIQQVTLLDETFVRREDFDYKSFISEHYQQQAIPVEIEFQADLKTVQQKISTLYGTLTPTSNGVLLRDRYSNADSMVRYLMAIDLPFVIHQPPELRTAFQRLGERLLQIAQQA